MKKKIIHMAIAMALLTACTSNNKDMEDQNAFIVKELYNNQGMKVKICNFGGRVMSLMVPDKDGNPGNIVLGYDKAEEYPQGNLYFGALIGRYANRIAKGRFILGDSLYQLACNNGENHLHGGIIGYNHVFWDVLYADSSRLELHYLSKDGEEGYPGNLEVWVSYTLNDDNELGISYKAKTDKPTIVNLTHHSFFNLKDGGRSDITGHEMQIFADAFTVVDANMIPTGGIRDVEASPMDFRTAMPVGKRIEEDYPQLKNGLGYDHNYVLNKTTDSLGLAARVFEPESRRIMEVWTTEPGLQFYSGNFLDGSDTGHDSTAYQYRSAFCLEAQHFPDSPNHPEFPSTMLSPGQTYYQKTIYKFSVAEE